MHFYQFNIGEYRRDTAHLTPEEHYIYRTLIDWYFLDEKPISSDIQLITRKLGLSNDRSTTVQQVFNDFFTLDGNRYIHGRIEADIHAYHQLLSVASKAGKASAAARKANKQAALERVLNGCCTTVQPNRNQKPETIKQLKTHTPEPCVSGQAEKPTPGQVTKAIISAGLDPTKTNPAHPTLTALIDAGATLDEFVGAATSAVAKNKPELSYVLGIVKKQREEALAMRGTIATGSLVKVKPWYIVNAEIEAMAGKLDPPITKKQCDNLWPEFARRVYTAYNITQEMVKSSRDQWENR